MEALPKPIIGRLYPEPAPVDIDVAAMSKMVEAGCCCYDAKVLQAVKAPLKATVSTYMRCSWHRAGIAAHQGCEPKKSKSM